MSNEVRDNRSSQRFELEVPGGLAFIDYRRAGAVVTLTHAEVPARLQGRGLGSTLVCGTLELVRQRGEKVVPRCPFVAAYIQSHPQFQDLLASRGA